MQPFESVAGIALPLDRADVDTDAIIPQRWLITVSRLGLGRGLFGNWRYDDESRDRAGFVLNQPAYAGARILVAGANYGCGSSREHAVWAHLDFGVRAVIAPSFGPIFFDNALRNGLLPVVLRPDEVATLLRQLRERPGAHCGVDLLRMQVRGPDGTLYRFKTQAGARDALLQGLDDIGMTERHLAEIDAFERRQTAQR